MEILRHSWNRSLLGAAALVGFVIRASLAADALVPRVPPTKPPRVVVPAASPSYVVLKFVEGTKVRLRGGRMRAAAGDLSAVEAVLARHGVAPGGVQRLFARPEVDLDADRVRGERRSRRQLADLNLYYRIPVDQSVDVGTLCDELNALPIVELAEPAPEAVEPPVDLAPVTPDLSGQQGYLNGAPGGIGALAVADIPGADGAGTTIVDIEYNWVLAHEDLGLPAAANIDTATLADPFPGDEGNHGTAVLGVLGARSNAYGMRGIVPAASLKVAPANTAQHGYDPARAINLAAGALAPGDVMLLEQQTGVCGLNLGPIEEYQAVFDAIAQATALGIVVVEAAGNGPVFLDDPACGGRYDRDVRDSGAIIVGAGTFDTHERLWFSTYGSRVDVQGWGHNVATTGYGYLFDPGDIRQRYTAFFSGTSSASPVVAGAVLALQGMRRATAMAPLDATEMRALLRATGTPQGGTDPIGPLPDLVLAAQVMLLCGDGVVDAGETCDDGNTQDGDACPSTCRRCAPAPRSSCRLPAVGQEAEFELLDRSIDKGDRLLWSWLRGSATDLAEFGAPMTTEDYDLCVYDAGGSRLAMGLHAPAGERWRAKGEGFEYGDGSGSSDGLTQLDLQAGQDGKARISAKGTGANLPLPDLVGLTLPLRVQLQSESGPCWEATFSAAGVRSHDAVNFRATAD